MRLFGQLWRQLHAMCQLVDRQARIHASTGFRHHMTDGVTVIGQHIANGISPKHRLGMTRAKHLGRKLHQQIHRIRPDVKFAIGGSADGIEIGK